VVHQVDRDLVLLDVKTLAGVIEDSTQSERFRSAVLVGFAGAALSLAALRIYGVLAYLVALRTREIGVRIALGARAVQLVTLIVQQGMMPVTVGLSVGLASALAITRLARTLLFGIESTDPDTYMVTIVILAVVAASACAIPALRAARVDPVIALRND
jgi:putative ABC transport system permease protein